MLTNKQRNYLRKQAHDLNPIFQIGKSGVHETMIEELKDALEARELIKISILQNAGEDPKQAGESIARKTSANLVQVIGSTLILYKASQNNRIIELPD